MIKINDKNKMWKIKMINDECLVVTPTNVYLNKNLTIK